MWLLIGLAANLQPKLLGSLPLNIQYSVVDGNYMITRVLVTVAILIFQKKKGIKINIFPLLFWKAKRLVDGIKFDVLSC